MTRHRLAQAVAIGILVLAAGIGLARKFGNAAQTRLDAEAPPREPQDAVFAMLDAARAGNVRQYLGSFKGDVAIAVSAAVAERGEPQFSRYLIDSRAAIRGVTAGDPVDIGGGEVKLPVEFVYAERNETQMVFLKNIGGTWKISRLENEAWTQTLVPYGTPANER